MSATDEIDLPPGSVLTDPPRLLLANVRPYAIAILLHKGCISDYELEATLVAHCNIDDLKVGGIDPFDDEELVGTRLQKLVNQSIDELAGEGIIVWSQASRNWVLTLDHPSKILKWAISTNAALPPRMPLYMKDQTNVAP